MPTHNEADSLAGEILTAGEWIIRVRRPEGAGPFPVLLLLHGWTGDENSMWVFTARLPRRAWWIAPRAPWAAASGYSWCPQAGWPWVDDFYPALEALAALMQADLLAEADWQRLIPVGFSQGAALGYAWALLGFRPVMALAGLAGFLPEGAEALARNRPLWNVPVFMAHGLHDPIVPINRARQAAEVLQQAGAVVRYCEDPVEHKLGAACFKGLAGFVKDCLETGAG